MRPVDLVFWIDRKDIVHLGAQPRGPDDYRLVACGEHQVRDLKRAERSRSRMRSRAYDKNEVVHLTPWKGAQLPSCCVEVETDEMQSMPVLSPMFLPNDVPLTCVKCIAIEVQLKQEAEAEEEA